MHRERINVFLNLFERLACIRPTQLKLNSTQFIKDNCSPKAGLKIKNNKIYYCKLIPFCRVAEAPILHTNASCRPNQLELMVHINLPAI